MTKYACFSGNDYEAVGGWDDLDGLADTLDAAKTYALSEKDWAHIVILDDNPRIISMRLRKPYRDLKRRLQGGQWYDEGTQEFRVLTVDDELQYSNMEPFEADLVSEWKERYEAQQRASTS